MGNLLQQNLAGIIWHYVVTYKGWVDLSTSSVLHSLLLKKMGQSCYGLNTSNIWHMTWTWDQRSSMLPLDHTYVHPRIAQYYLGLDNCIICTRHMSLLCTNWYNITMAGTVIVAIPAKRRGYSHLLSICLHDWLETSLDGPDRSVLASSGHRLCHSLVEITITGLSKWLNSCQKHVIVYMSAISYLFILLLMKRKLLNFCFGSLRYIKIETQSICDMFLELSWLVYLKSLLTTSVSWHVAE